MLQTNKNFIDSILRKIKRGKHVKHRMFSYICHFTEVIKTSFFTALPTEGEN